MHRTKASLADGRDLFFYDDAPGRVVTPDRRDLGPVSRSSQMRHDPLTDEWVLMAAHRQARTHRPPTHECPLCPSTPERPTEVPAADYQVAVFENRFPSLSVDADLGGARVDHPLVELRPGIGRCEVVCFASDHDQRFADLTPAQARLVIDAWADRTTELAATDGVAQVFCFESRGAEIGVTLNHPHGQIYAYPFLTPRTARMREVARAHRERTGGDLTRDLIDAECRAGTRIVADTEHWIAFVPAAARWPVEVHLHPRRDTGTLADLTDAERDDLAAVYLDLLRRLDRLYDAPLPYIAAWHQASGNDPEQLDRLHLQLFSIRRAADKLKYLASSESGMGAFITDVLPEDVAERLRELACPETET